MEESISLSNHSLITLEESVQDEGGCWLYFNRLPPKEEEEDDKKKKKGAPVDEAQPSFAKAWIDLSNFKEPGCQELE